MVKPNREFGRRELLQIILLAPTIVIGGCGSDRRSRGSAAIAYREGDLKKRRAMIAKVRKGWSAMPTEKSEVDRRR